MKESCSVRHWVWTVSWMQQGVLFAVIRGCDGMSKEDVNKIIVRGYRNVILKSARNEGSFLGMIPNQLQLKGAMDKFICDLDKYPMHFVLHLTHAAEIIGYKHPEKQIKEIWLNFYLAICKAMHLDPETKERMDERLEDDVRIVESHKEKDK